MGWLNVSWMRFFFNFGHFTYAFNSKVAQSKVYVIKRHCRKLKNQKKNLAHFVFSPFFDTIRCLSMLSIYTPNISIFSGDITEIIHPEVEPLLGLCMQKNVKTPENVTESLKRRLLYRSFASDKE